ncbi:phytanoyl-CoA dioxygenase family protein [Nisaea sp.]|uniref:phytanoyl-CoA dioxygenase family protein n=1 Tax=Nisaea sp. TaxID=2024842 RepID=UPI002B26E8B7|nr:phytanoyl-CoA dioxygenase family protein [Nisaea sp.]
MSRMNTRGGEAVSDGGISARQQFSQQLSTDGFAIGHGILPLPMLDQALECFERDVRQSRTAYLRQSTKREYHRFGKGGLLNPLMNIHLEEDSSFQPFREAVAAIMAHPSIAGLLDGLSADPFRVVQSLWLDESCNGPHQDCAYTDTVPSGHVVGVWIPLWDSADDDNNRLFVVPGSHRTVVETDSERVADNRYIADVAHAMNSTYQGRKICVSTHRGDVVFFDSATIHGAQAGRSGRLPRIAAHYAPESCLYRAVYLASDVPVSQYGTRIAAINSTALLP